MSFLLPNVDIVPHRVEKEYAYGSAVSFPMDTDIESRDPGPPIHDQLRVQRKAIQDFRDRHLRTLVRCGKF